MARRRFQNPMPVVHGNWWTIVVRKDVFRDGKLHRIRERVRILPASCGQREAQRKAAEHLRPLNQGLTPSVGGMTLQTFVDTLYMPFMKQYRAITTYNRADGVFRNYLLPMFGDRCLTDISSLTLQTYFLTLDSGKLTHESRDKIRDVLSSAFNYAKTHGLLTVNPVEAIRIPPGNQPRPKKYFLTPDQFANLLALIPEPYASMVYVAIFTGLRVSELIGLQWEDIHEAAITIDKRYCRGDLRHPKTPASMATIPVNRSVIGRINSLRNLTVHVRAGLAVRKYKVVKSDGPEDFVFQSVKDGKPMRDNNILCRFIKPAGRKLGMPWVNWLVMRRSHSNWLRMVGADLKDRQAQMRHAHPQVTADVYDQFFPENQRAVVDRLDSLVLAPMTPNGTNPNPAQDVDLMVARDGVEPPTPAFSGLKSVAGKPLTIQ